MEGEASIGFQLAKNERVKMSALTNTVEIFCELWTEWGSADWRT